MSIRSGASAPQWVVEVSDVPRGARTGRAPCMTFSLTAIRYAGSSREAAGDAFGGGDDGAVEDGLVGRLEVGGEEAVGPGGDVAGLGERADDGRGGRPRLERGAELDAAGGGDELDGEDPRQGVDRAA